jgi:hypothetical protein
MTLPVRLPCLHHCRHLAFPPLAAVGSQTALSGGLTASGIEAGGPIATSGGQTARPHMAPSSVASPTSARRPRLRPPLTRCPRFHPHHARPRCPQLHSRIPRHQCPNTTRVALGLRRSHRHCLYISTSRQPSSDDHVGQAGLLATGRQTHVVGHLVVAALSGAHLHPRRPRRPVLAPRHGGRI